MLGNTQKRIYLNISEGKIVRRTDKGIQKYDYLEGDLERIYSKDREFRGERVPYWYLDMRDPESGDLYSLGFSASSGVWRSLVLSLGSLTNTLLPIRIVPYKRGEYDRVSVYSGEERLDWISDLPPVQGAKGTPERLQSIQEREDYISGLVSQINQRIGTPGTVSPGLQTAKRGRGRRVPGSIYPDDL